MLDTETLVVSRGIGLWVLERGGNLEFPERGDVVDPVEEETVRKSRLMGAVDGRSSGRRRH